MKKTITILLLAFNQISYSQINADIGFTSRISPTLHAGIEAPIRNTQFNIDLGARISQDNLHPIVGLQGGYSFIVDRYNQELRLSAGLFYHSGMLPIDLSKTERIETVRLGGSIRFKWSVNVYCVVEYNGETMNAGIGYLFKPNRK
jgi:hypothetical protein